QDAREEFVVVAELEQLGVGIFEQLNGRGGPFGRIVNQRSHPAYDQHVAWIVRQRPFEGLLAFARRQRTSFAADQLRDAVAAFGEQRLRVHGGGREMDDVIVFGE